MTVRLENIIEELSNVRRISVLNSIEIVREMVWSRERELTVSVLNLDIAKKC